MPPRFAPSNSAAVTSPKTYDRTYGARPLKRKIQEVISNPLALALLKKEFAEGDKVKVDYKDEEYTLEKAG